MNIKQRLSAIESTGSRDAFAEYAEPLVTLLANVDALFWPERKPLKDMAAVNRLRQQYHNSGIGWTSTAGGSSSSRAWKSDQRLREAMQAARLITLTKSKANLPNVRLTTEAETTARALIGQPVCPVACELLFKRLGQAEANDGYCAETWLFNSNYRDRPTNVDWDRPTVLILPLLVAGVVESKPSTVGHIFFRNTGKPVTFEPSSVNYQEALCDRYLDQFYASLEQRNKLPKTSEIAIPLSATR